MPDMKKSVLLASVVVFTLFLGVAASSAEPYRNPATGLVFPDMMAGLTKAKVSTFEEPGLGIGVGYNGPGKALTIFVYDLRMKTVPKDVRSSAFKAHYQQAIGDIYQAGKSGVIRDVNKVSEDEITVGPPGGRKALLATFTFILGERDVTSYLVLMEYRNQWVKIRYSHDRGDGDGKATLDSFLSELGAQMKKSAP